MPSPTRLYTVDDVRAMPDDGNRYEIIDGELFVTPAPGTRHQRTLGRLYLLLGNYVSRHGLGELYFAPVDVVLGRLTLVEPDMLFIHRSRSDVITEREVIAAPDLAIEILSPSTARTDRGRKRALYQERGVTEYWIVDCEQEQVEVWRPGAMAAVVYGGGEEDTIRWQPDAATPALTVDLHELFRSA